MHAPLAIAYEQRRYMDKRQVRCQVGAVWSEWRYLSDEDMLALDAEAAYGDGACLDVDAMYRVARACWPGPEAMENP